MPFTFRCVLMFGSGKHVWKFYCLVPCSLLLGAFSGCSFAYAAPTAEQSAIIAEQTKLIEANPKDYKAYFRRGRAYFDARLLTEAESDFKKGIKINPESQGLWVWLASVHQERGQLAQSLECVREAQRIGELTADLGALEVCCLKGLGRHEECILRASNLIHKFPNCADLYYFRAQSRSAINGDSRLIGDDFRTAVNLAPTNASFRKRLKKFSAAGGR